VFSLLDEARDLCGCDAELARTLDVPLHHPHEWRAGKRAISATTVGLLCDVLKLDGQEARRLAAEAVIGTTKTRERQTILRRAFFRVLKRWRADKRATRDDQATTRP